MHRTPFKQLRQKFAHDLEDILECPVCLSQFKGLVVQCLCGHNICNECYAQLPVKECPLCKHKYYGTRNFLAQNIVNKFDEIKTSLIDPTNSINQAAVQDKMCIGTQTSPFLLKTKTDLNGGSSIAKIANQSDQTSTENPTKRVTRQSLRKQSLKDNKQNENNLPVQIKASTEMVQSTASHIVTVKPAVGKFPCRIHKCNALLSHQFMISHLREDHAKFLVDAGIVEGNEYIKKWKIRYIPESIFHRAIYISNMGIFFIKIGISAEGNVHAQRMHLNSSKDKVKHFKYSLRIGKNDTFFSYEGKPLASRTVSQSDPEDLFISGTRVKDLMKKERSFEYILKITYSDKVL